jgi:hypothetical protein
MISDRRPSTAAADADAAPFAAPARDASHRVRFYDEDEGACTTICEFLLEGRAQGEAVVVIASAANRAAVVERLAGRREELDALVAEGSVVFHDAQGVLEAVVVDGLPDAGRFREAVDGILDGVATGTRRVRIFGEIVELLCRSGNPEAALRLEELWHGYVRERGLSLLCAYRMNNLHRELNGGLYQRICAAHDCVVGEEEAA